MEKAKETPARKRRHRFIRVAPNQESPVRVDINGGGIIEVMKALDISEGGICIRVTHRFKGSDMDEPVSFIIYLPDPINQFFRVEGRIKHVRNDLFGVQFTNLSDKSRTLIRRYVARWLQKRRLWDFIRYSLHILR